MKDYDGLNANSHEFVEKHDTKKNFFSKFEVDFEMTLKYGKFYFKTCIIQNELCFKL